MNENMIFLRFIILFTFLLLVIASCEEEIPGCTDPEAMNYSSDANMDDGNCAYARDKFIGNYFATSDGADCGLWNADLHFVITKDPDNTNNVKALFDSPLGTLNHGSMGWIGAIDGNTLKFNNSTTNAPGNGFCGAYNFNGGVVKLTARATLEGNELSFSEFYFSAFVGDGFLLCYYSCDVEATRSN
jgi:hypothetical protein